MREEPKSTNKTISLELNIITFEKMRELLNKYREMYGLQTYDDLIIFLINNQPRVE
ncbi:MAG: hypothetical protein KQA41_04530 [Candidatus Aenigmarchaeota archaeon]|nr:hypothetical protein [Candidatus Aenigmarchaeota archaeon]